MNRLKRILSFILLALQLPSAYLWYIVIYTLKADSYIIKQASDGAYSLVFEKDKFFEAFLHEHLSFLLMLAVILILSLVVTKMNNAPALVLIYALLCMILILLFAQSGSTYTLAEYTLFKGTPTPLPYSFFKYILLGMQTAVAAILLVLSTPKNKR